jgi:hypothetical protein
LDRVSVHLGDFRGSGETHPGPTPAHPQVKIARAQSGITLDSEEGELGADFTDLGNTREVKAASNYRQKMLLRHR